MWNSARPSLLVKYTVLFFTVIVMMSVLNMSGIIAQTQPEDDDSRFVLAVIPDTQRYTDYRPEVFESQIQWIIDHTAERDIAFTLHVGDITENDIISEEWTAASEIMGLLEAEQLSYLIVPGNHDILNEVRDTERDFTNEMYLDYFPVERDAEQATFGGASPVGTSRYHIFEAERQQFLVLGLDYRVGQPTLDWAQGVLDEHPTLPVILLSHDILTSLCELGDETCVDGGVLTENGDYLWENFIRQNDQIFLTINGHSWPPEHITLRNDAGHNVEIVLTDYQAEYFGGNGHMRLLEFDLVNNTIDATTFSPWVEQKPENRRGPSDELEKTDARNQFTIDIDFAERFADFAD